MSKKKILIYISGAILSLVILTTTAFGINILNEGFQVLKGAVNPTAITVNSVCKKVVNNSTSSDVFVPTKTTAEWNLFISNKPSYVDLSECVGAPGAPTIVTATAGISQASIAFTAPASDGGSPILSYKVTSSPESKTGTGLVSPIIVNGLTNGTTYTFTLTATNALGTSSPSAVSNSVTPSIVIGGTYQGGQITYIDGTGKKGLVVTNTDQGNLPWSSGTATTTAVATAIGTGNANTNTIVAKHGTGSYAARLCYDLVLNSYNDWYLPSKDELNQIFINKDTLGGFAFNPYYWSSSEVIKANAWDQYFYNGTQASIGKFNSFPIRCVRSFDTAAATIPSAPTILITGGNQQITLSWSEPSNGGSTITGYKVYRGTTSGTETLLTTLGNVFTYNNTGLTNATTYYYKMSAINANGESASSTEVSFTPTAPKRIFVTSIQHDGNLGGLTGADSICATRATAASLAGTWKAWLSDSTTNAADRITHNAGGYKNMNNEILAISWADFVDGTLLAPIKYTEFGAASAIDGVWTSTLVSGLLNPSNSKCANWLSNTAGNFSQNGSASASGSSWTNTGIAVSCLTSTVSLYCIEQ